MADKTLAEHKATLEEMLTAMQGTGRKAGQLASVLEGYIRRHALPAAVALFPSGAITIVWEE